MVDAPSLTKELPISTRPTLTLKKLRTTLLQKFAQRVLRFLPSTCAFGTSAFSSPSFKYWGERTISFSCFLRVWPSPVYRHSSSWRCLSGLLFAYGFVVVYATSRTLANNYGYSSLKIGLVTIAYGAGVLILSQRLLFLPRFRIRINIWKSLGWTLVWLSTRQVESSQWGEELCRGSLDLIS